MFEIVGNSLQTEFQMLTKSHWTGAVTEFTGKFYDMHRLKQIIIKHDTWLPQNVLAFTLRQ